MANFLCQSTRYDYRWSCNFISAFERLVRRKNERPWQTFGSLSRLNRCCVAPNVIAIENYYNRQFFFSRLLISTDFNIKAVWTETIIFIFIFSLSHLCLSTHWSGALFGGVCGGFLLGYGRRRLLTLMSLPFSLSWIWTVFAKSVETMYATAFIGGFCCSIVSMVTQVSRSISKSTALQWTTQHATIETPRIINNSQMLRVFSPFISLSRFLSLSFRCISVK